MQPCDDVYAVQKVAAADASAVLDSVAASGLVERGCVVMIGVEAIRDRAGERWDRKREDVWAYVARKLAEHLPAQDLRHRVSDTDFLVAMTSASGAAAQAIAMNILEEVLTHFLGSAEKVDLKIKAVTAISGGTLECTALDPHQIAVASAATKGPTTSLAKAEARRNPVSFVVSTGQALQIDFSLEPVFALRDRAITAVRVRAVVSRQDTGTVVSNQGLAKLADDDIAVIDRAAQNYAAVYLTREAPGSPPMMIPMSFRTLSCRKGRNTLMTIAGVPPEQLKRSVIIELNEVYRGTPIGRLEEVISLVGQLTRNVVVRLQPERDMLAHLIEARSPGVVVDIADLEADSRGRATAANLRGSAPFLVLCGLSDKRGLVAASQAGFTHATLRLHPETAQRPAA